jgi:pimeloyl-ACP methyl ester carboxylesterase
MRSWLVLTTFVLTATVVRGDALDQSPSKFAKSGDLKVHYKTFGLTGKTALVLVHGWCCDHTVWRDQIEALNGRVRMIALDLPGFGKSDRPKIEYTMDVFAKGIHAVLEDAGIEKAVLVGHSMGTPAIRQFYRQYPEKTQALIVVDGGLRKFFDKKQSEEFLAMFQEETFKEVAPKFLLSMLPPDFPAEKRKVIAGLIASTSPQVAISSMKNMLDEKWWKDDPIRVPSQALMAKAPYWTDDYKKFVKELAPGLDYREFDGVGHFLFMEKPKEFNDAMIGFLKKQGAYQ